MKKMWRLPQLAGRIVVPVIALFSFAQCTEDQEEVASQDAAPVEEVAKFDEFADPIASLTVDGLFTEFTPIADCKTCDYVVPANATVVDGKELGIKPGSTVCLDAKLKYGNLELINMNGTEKEPIKVAYSIAFGKPVIQEAEQTLN